ncbi:hypothetical protein MBH78_02840 [Oceanimonas sp. NS1]|nr:hypothetical protein [Oceanimonas sp. NS1]
MLPGESLPALVIRERLDSLLHGSCRKPHHAAPDGLVAADDWLAERHRQPRQRPALLMMSGDQIYADDVAGPMLTAIHQLIEVLGLYDEQLEGALVADSAELFASPSTITGAMSCCPTRGPTCRCKSVFLKGRASPSLPPAAPPTT